MISKSWKDQCELPLGINTTRLGFNRKVELQSTFLMSDVLPRDIDHTYGVSEQCALSNYSLYMSCQSGQNPSVARNSIATKHATNISCIRHQPFLLISDAVTRYKAGTYSARRSSDDLSKALTNGIWECVSSTEVFEHDMQCRKWS